MPEIVLKKSNSLSSDFPDLVTEWDYEKNGDLSPSDFTRGSNRKVWWKCSNCGYEWPATIDHRTNGRGCPKCAKKRMAEKLTKKNLIQGQTDLGTLFPDIAKEWHPSFNGDKTPSDYSPNSMKKAWWGCPRGHAYDLKIAYRTNQKQGCPYCAGKRILPGFNDLLSNFPTIASEWDYEHNTAAPDGITAHSNKKVYWKCPEGHSYLMSVCERTRTDGKALSCPYCSGKKVLQGFNDLATVRPDLASEWDYESNGDFKPTDVVEFSMKSTNWICTKGHHWKTTVANRSRGNGCPYCANQKLLVGYNDFKTTFPSVAAEWDYEKNERRPEDYIAGNHEQVWWKCPKCGYGWKAQIKERSHGKTGCPNCTFYYKTSVPEQAVFYYLSKAFPNAVNSYRPDFLGAKEIDVFVAELNLAIEYDGKGWHQDIKRDIEKSDLLRSAGVDLIRIREEGLPDIETGDHIIKCPCFSGNLDSLEEAIRELMGYIQDKYGVLGVPEVNLKDDYVKITQIFSVKKNQQTLAFLNPKILKEWDYEKNGSFTPDKVTPHSRKIAWWRCSKCGAEWQQQINTKMHGGLFCEHCSKTLANEKRAVDRIRAGKTKSVLEYELLAKEWDYEKNEKDPLFVSRGSDQKVWWKCSACGNSFQMVVKNRTLQGQGCPVCGRKKSAETRLRGSRT